MIFAWWVSDLAAARSLRLLEMATPPTTIPHETQHAPPRSHPKMFQFRHRRARPSTCSLLDEPRRHGGRRAVSAVVLALPPLLRLEAHGRAGLVRRRSACTGSGVAQPRSRKCDVSTVGGTALAGRRPRAALEACGGLRGDRPARGRDPGSPRGAAKPTRPGSSGRGHITGRSRGYRRGDAPCPSAVPAPDPREVPDSQRR